MDLTTTQQMIAALVAGSVMTAEQASAIDVMADVKTSWANQNLGRSATLSDIADALKEESL
jgi:hypothetical protein